MEFLKNLGISTTYIYVVGGFMAFYLIAMILYMRYKKNQGKNWEAQNPHGSKIYIKSKSIVVKTDGIYIHSVDGEKPLTFVEGTKTGLYVLPGKHVIEATFTSSRPGIVHKTVTTSYGPLKVEVHIESRKAYGLSFNEDSQGFEFEEVN